MKVRAQIHRLGKGPPLMLLPGAGADSSTWEPVAEALAPRFELHLVDVAGFADLPAAVGGVPALIGDLVAYLDGLDSVVVVGHSFGAFVAWRLALEAAGVRGVVALDGIPSFGALLPSSSVASDRRARLAAIPPAELGAQLTPSIRAMARGSRHVQQLVDMAGRSSPEAIAEAMHYIWTVDLRPELSHGDKPTLLLLPSDDHLADEERRAKHAIFRTQVEALPRAQVVEVAESGHYLMLDQPIAVAEHIARFADAH
jgi:pimeloyl-ACP methyl ester carboxylesterase